MTLRGIDPSQITLMQARDAGYLNLDDEVSKFEPRFWLNNPFRTNRNITFNQVAAHLAGK